MLAATSCLIGQTSGQRKERTRNESAEEQQSNSSHTPNKRLDYHVGMFMTADDWRQEQEHFEWKHALAKRWLHGYGTVSGLKVYAAADSSALAALL